MCWSDGPGRLLRSAALLAAAAGLSACAEPAGESTLVPLHGDSLYANMALQADRAGTGGRLARAFAAGVEPTVTFAFDDASLDARAQAILDGQADWLRAHPGVPMTIVGHADLVGPERYNYGLGLRRAESARRYLVARGVPAELLLAVESRGEQNPVVPTVAPERLNRRAVTVVGRPAGAGPGTGLDGVYAARIYDAYQTGRVGATEVESIRVN
jgi:outer membrane protein OmpA-like peptidoglycan-associated protein